MSISSERALVRSGWSVSVLLSAGCAAGYTSYEIELQSPLDVKVEARDAWEHRHTPDESSAGWTTLYGPAVGGNARIASTRQRWFRDVRFEYRALADANLLRLEYRDDAGRVRERTLVDAGELRLDGPFAGQVWGGGNLSLSSAWSEGGTTRFVVWHTVYGEDDAGEQKTVFQVALETPTANVGRVTEVTERPRGIFIGGLVVSTIVGGAGAGFLATPSFGNMRYAVGVPLLAVGVAGAIFMVRNLVLPARQRREHASQTLELRRRRSR